MKESILNFKVSSALKNIIGKELITDQYIAIFELVKNSFDAHAKDVTITFENIYDLNKARIIVQDNGKGMDYNDLVNKWLFVAYSAKKDGTEDQDLEVIQIESSDDYRNKIKTKRSFAGAKGVGRFSCDRLGKKLNLITIKDKKNAIKENLEVDWESFEKDSKEEFIEVPVKHKVLEKTNYTIECGTILEISGLRDEWDRITLLKLKRSLEKLINPNNEKENKNFSIQIIAKDELSRDKSQLNERDKVNGYVKNTIFEKLNLKTTQIISELSTDGKIVTTTLMDRGTFIYRVKEKNPYNTINDIKINLFILNRSAKANFTRLMGIEPVNYGSVFVYKNGFRIYPYGEIGEDIFGIDKRKQQGYSRYLGTRELIGRIEIYGNEDNLKETTSRDGGLIKTTSYDELSAFFYDKALKRLEKYVVDVIRWGEPREDSQTGKEQPALNPEDVKTEILGIIANLTRTSNLIHVEYNKNFLKVINDKQEKSASAILKNLSKSALKLDDPDLQKEVENTKKYFNNLIAAKNEAEKEIEEKEVKLNEISTELENKTHQVLFLKSISSHDVIGLVNLFHQTGIGASTIENRLIYFNRRVKKGIPITNKELLSLIQEVAFENRKIKQIANFVTKANLVLDAQETKADIISFIMQYMEKASKFIIGNDLNVIISNFSKDEFITKFRPLEITIIIDNMMNNSKKANAKTFEINVQKISENLLRITFKDDGQGLDKSIKNPDEIFDMGFTTTSGSGLGLYHVADIVKNMNGIVKVNTKNGKGIEFILEVVK